MLFLLAYWSCSFRRSGLCVSLGGGGRGFGRREDERENMQDYDIHKHTEPERTMDQRIVDWCLVVMVMAFWVMAVSK